ncbi:type II toxin-antitoxin system Phd/YefM family antitoxin, partial [Desulfobacter sp.]
MPYNYIGLRYKEVYMRILSVTEARSNLYRLIDQTSSSHEPIIITGKRG